MTPTSTALTGSWHVAVSTPTQGTFPALITFGAEGTVLSAESPGPFESAGHGNWIRHEDGSIAFTLIALLGSQESKLSGKLKVTSIIQPASAGQGWHGPFKVEGFDASGQVTFTDRGSFQLTRIAIESLD
jgi:hypothetical protein